MQKSKSASAEVYIKTESRQHVLASDLTRDRTEAFALGHHDATIELV